MRKDIILLLLLLSHSAGMISVQAQILINEISYNPPESGNDSLEYIELHNAGDVMVDISGWYFTAGIQDTFPDVQLQPGEYFVTAINAGAMMNVFGIQVHEWQGGALNNNGEVIILVDANGTFIDSVLFDDTDPWPTEPDGSGPSLELVDPGLDNNDGTNWQASGAGTGKIINGFEVRGTPGAKNSGGGMPGPAVTIELANFAFTPKYAVVKVGDVVRWVNQEAEFHNVNGLQNTFPGNPEGFTSGVPASGPWQFDFQFTLPGKYEYQCDPHASMGMTGAIFVYDPDTYTDFSLEDLRLIDANGSSLFDGVPTTVTAVVHGVNFQPPGYSFYIINPDNVGINVFSFDPGSYIVTEGDAIKVSGVIDQFNGLLEIVPDTIEVLSTGNLWTSPVLVDEITEVLEGSHLAIYPFEYDSIVPTGMSGFNVYTTHEDGNKILIRVDADSGIEFNDIVGNAVRGIGTQFDPSFPFTSGYQILALEFLFVDGIELLEKDAVQMTPNPASERLSVASDYSISRIEIFALDGRRVLSKKAEGNQARINISSVPSGMHIVKVYTTQGIWASMLIVTR